MHLERVEIVGFRGINRLSLMLEQNNVLIGENAWEIQSAGRSDAAFYRLSLTCTISCAMTSGSSPAIFRGGSIICISFNLPRK